VTPPEAYTAAAFLTVFLVALADVAIMAAKIQRLQGAMDELTEEVNRRLADSGRTTGSARSLGSGWSALSDLGVEQVDKP